MNSRHLTKEEIKVLLSQNCFSAEWSDITVREGFSTVNIRSTRFEGRIQLGDFSGTLEVEKDIFKKCGIYDSHISNCVIGDNVYISGAKNLSGYVVGDNVAIENVGSLAVTGESSFGNGTEIDVLNEGGGRTLPIFDRLSSQIAYLTVLYRHDPDFTDKILGLIRDYCDTKQADRGLIQTGARIRDSLVIRNVCVGSYTVISGATLLEEGTIQSCVEAPAFIGEGVMAKKFIVLSGSRVDGGAILDKSFVGQGVKMGKQFSSENSLFFANCEAFHGEACSLFAGPYTVTHHKSTLLIASLFSFFNAGSGTNQSNHMYKLGPVHQGIVERGSKTGSSAYLLLPCRIGAYTVVMGKHYANFDTADLPFSYISEEKGKSEITPAMNMFTVGTRRDIDKWPVRDRRKDPDRLDLLHFDLFNPYIAGRIINGINILNELIEKTPREQDYINYKGILIHRLLLKTARKYYEIGLKVYTGQEVVRRLGDIDPGSSADDIRKMLAPQGTDDAGRWVDICGMFSPAAKIEELVEAVKARKIKSVDELEKYLAVIYNSYHEYAWNWCCSLISRKTDDTHDPVTIDSLIRIITDWKDNTVKLNNMILKDAEKEFDTGSRTGYGIDGAEDTRDKDFQSVRGAWDKNTFVTTLLKESAETEARAEKIITILQSIKA
jgi:NDP-sugar pyrophosphorylase family protein